MPEVIALLTNKTFLMKKTTDGKWADFIAVTKVPAIGGAPEKIEVTRLKDTKKRYILGLQDSEDLEFEANYLLADYQKLTAADVADAVNTYRLCFGDNLGTDGCFEWSGKVSARIDAQESNNARKLIFTISDEGEEAIKEVEALKSTDIAA